jgi:hypothetical protein
MISSFAETMMTDYLFLPGEITPMQINRVGEVVVEPLECPYNFAPRHGVGSLPRRRMHASPRSEA